MRFGLNFFPSFRPQDSTTADYYQQCLRIAERVGALGDAQALLVVVRGGAVLRAEGGEKVKPESHRERSPATRRASRTTCAAPGLRPCGAARRIASPAARDCAPRAASCWPRSAPARI